ncbi:MAG TPA: hypothetical protein VFW28_18030 [Micropepsaceae bacterium]|nr:hypothetical protein [Micropepsaceae bacterium]
MAYIVKLTRKDGARRSLSDELPDTEPTEGAVLSIDVPGASIVRVRVIRITKGHSASPAQNVGPIDIVYAEEI